MPRLAEDGLHRWLAARRRKPPVLRGARQVGKTTLVRRFAAAAGMPLCEVNLERSALGPSTMPPADDLDGTEARS